MEMYINVINCGQTKITVSPQSNTAKCIVNNLDSDYCNYFYNLRLVTESIVCLMECIRLDTNEREKKNKQIECRNGNTSILFEVGVSSN